jgi:hydroxymethylpyrimidine/phosphomethylpyrimidine kinase
VTSVLVIAGTDCSGGAGLTRDVETLTRLGVSSRCAVTAVTVQTQREFRARQLLSPELVSAQILAALAEDVPGAIKIGMLGDAAIVRAVAAALPAHTRVPVVLDPVLLSSSGGELLDAAGRAALCAVLLPRVTLLTPNLAEAATLLGRSCADSAAERLAQAQQLVTLGAAAVLIKGGHDRGAESSDLLLCAAQSPLTLHAARRPGTRRGTGCVLASAIAAELARGASLADACARAKEHVTRLWS